MTVIANLRDRFDLTDKIAVITGGAGLLGLRHAEAIAEMGGTPVLIDIDDANVRARAAELAAKYRCNALGIAADICQPEAVAGVF